MARPNPDWPGNAALRAQSEVDVAPVASAGPVRLPLAGAAAQVVLSLLVTGDTPGPCMPETLAMIVRLNGGEAGEVSMTPPLARCLRGLLIRTAVPPEVEEDVAALITSLQLQMMSTAHG